MQTYFIRHTSRLDVNRETRERLWEERLIAIHYPEFVDGRHEQDNRSLNPDDHQRDGRNILRRFIALGRTGGYVCGEYHPFEGCLIGVVEPGTSVRPFEGCWGTEPTRIAVLKTLPLVRVRHVPTSAAAPIMVARPRQGTFCEWRKAGNAIQRLVEGTSAQPSLDDLAASQQEVLCAEYLRSTLAVEVGLPRLAHLLVPVGRTLRHVDIMGIAEDGRPIYAQVTHSTLDSIRWKLTALEPYATGHRILFCDCGAPSSHRGIHIFPIRRAFEEFSRMSLGSRWLAASIPGEPTPLITT